MIFFHVLTTRQLLTCVFIDKFHWIRWIFFFYLSIVVESSIIKKLTWYELISKIRRNYYFAIESYQIFCMLSNKKTWLILIKSLKKWSVAKIFENIMSKQKKIKSNTIQMYLTKLKSYHIDKHLFLIAFENLKL